ncbi:MAG TPA: acyl-CoA dehydrogenase family protein [Polyangia bacterium]|nr:acyl-CoA dehydrogenase family protein [Polyangia bacterium]
MHIDYSPVERALQDELRDYFARLMTPDLEEELAHSEGGGPQYQRALAQMGRDGWLGVGWPKEYGGQGRSPVEQFIFFDEVQRAGFPIPLLTLNTVGPTIMRCGTAAQKARFLPAILRGEVHFSIGYTEPEAGTDLASLKTRAVRDDDHYVVDGQKVFTSLAAHADFIWLAVRTDPDAPKHKGISLLIVDAHAPGVSMTPTPMLGDNPLCTTYYEGVRVPRENLVGEENQGWKIITTQLNHERVALCASGMVARTLEDVSAWARATTDGDGKRVIDRAWVQANLARVHARVAVLRLLNWRQACSIDRGALSPAEASTVKVFGSELYVEAYRLLLEVLGVAGALKQGSPGAVLRGRIERYYRSTLVLTFGGGTNEVQRDIIAMAGLGIPRAPY